jgi:hypothetical protein
MTGGSSGFKEFLDSPIKSGNDEKGIIQRSYKMMSVVKPRLLRRGELTNKLEETKGGLFEYE